MEGSPCHKAHLWLDELITGKVRNVVAIANREKRSRCNISMMINFTFFANVQPLSVSEITRRNVGLEGAKQAI